ncbi:MAG: hypothetical protein RL477_2163 [Pseudomonadota bacterium]
MARAMTTPCLSEETTIAGRARAVLAAADPAAKAVRARRLRVDFAAGRMAALGTAGAPGRPARPHRPQLLAPRDMPRRRAGRSEAGRVALLHALAHIELNAVDLAVDMVARFAPALGDPDFVRDWLDVAAEEATHYDMLAARLADFGAAYGDLPAHDGLWEAAEKTADDLLARLAIVPLVLEARGLDVTPMMIERMERFGDGETARLLGVIYREEIGHVATGCKWFERVATRRGLEPRAAWLDLVNERFKGELKPPFNDAARAAAGLPADWYQATTA